MASKERKKRSPKQPVVEPQTIPAPETETPTPDLYNISQLAEHFELDRAVVRKRLNAVGIKPVQEKAKEKLYRLQDAEWAINSQENPGLDVSKRRKAEAEAELLEIKLQRQRGELVAIKDVRDELQEVFKRLYQRLAVQYPREIAAQLYKAESPGQITEILRHDMGRIFNDLRSDYKSFF